MNEANRAKGVNEESIETNTRITCFLLAFVRPLNGGRAKTESQTLESDSIVSSRGLIANNVQTKNPSGAERSKMVELKKRLFGRMLGLTVLTFAISAYAATPSPVPTGLPILSPGGVYAATGLVAKVSRSQTQPGKAIATLSWTATNEPGRQQRIDITKYWDGFERGRFNTVGPLTPGQSVVELNNLEPGIDYYWRVLSLTPQGWVPSQTARCAVRAYPVDRPEKKVQ